MTEIFSDRRLIDYFIIFDLNISGFIPMNNTTEHTAENNEIKIEDNFPLNVSYIHRTIKRYPKDNYRDKNLYELNLESIYEMLPCEKVFLKKPPNKFFALMFTDALGVHYYGFFLKIFMELERDHQIYSELNDSANNEIKIYSPKYLSFFSTNPFFISFKNLLEEIFYQSTLNNEKCYKVENMLNFLVYRMNMPKYETTQLSWTLNDKVYSFTKNVLKSEISYKLLFTHISIDKIVFLYFAFLVTSKIVFFHSEIQILSPILHLFTQLLYPFTENYSIINNLSTNLIELLECPTINIVVGIYKKDFQDIGALVASLKTSNTSLVYYDMDENKLVIENHEDMKKIDLLPKNRINGLIDRLCKCADIYDKDSDYHKNITIDFWEKFKSENVFNSNESTKKKIISKKRAESFIATNSTRSDIRRKTPTDSRESFSDDEVKNAFLDLNLSLIEAYDEKKHFKIDEPTQDLIFLTNDFIADSKPDIRNFMEFLTRQPLFDIFIQNLTHMADVRHKAELKATNPKFMNHTFELNQFVMEAAILPNFETNYEFILQGIKRRNANKSLQKLTKIKIFNTITISSPKFEKLPYKQTNIFSDPLHEELMIHDKAIKLNSLIIDFRNLNPNLIDDKIYNCKVFNEENDYLYKKYKQSRRHLIEDENSVKRNEGIMDENLKDRNNEVVGLKFPLSLQIKSYILENRELFKSFYGYYSSAVKNFITSIESKMPVKSGNNNDYIYFNSGNSVITGTNNLNNNNNNNTIQNNHIKTQANTLNNNLNTINNNNNNNFNTPNNNINLTQSSQIFSNTSLNAAYLIKNFKKSFLNNNTSTNMNNFASPLSENNLINTNLRSKEEYIKHFNNFYDTYIKNQTRPVIEFKFNFGLNVIQATSFCEYCMKPNNLWEVRREFSYTKTKKETTTKCKFCGQYFIPYFYVIEESQGQKDSKQPKFFKKLRKNNTLKDQNSNLNTNQSFSSEVGKKEIFVLNQSVSGGVKEKENNSCNSKTVKRVEYMSFEHIVQAYYDYEVEEKNLKTLDGGVKKFPPSLFYNICILAGEVRVKIESNKMIHTFSLDKFFEKNDRIESRNFNGNKNDLLSKDNLINSNNLKKTKTSGKNLITNGVNPETNLINNINEDSGNLENNDFKFKNYNPNNVINLFNEFYERKKREIIENKIGVKKKTNLISNKFLESSAKKTHARHNKKSEKTVNIKFDLKDLMAEEKYKIFLSEIKNLTTPGIYEFNLGNQNPQLINKSVATKETFKKNLNTNFDSNSKSLTSKFILNDEKKDFVQKRGENITSVEKNLNNQRSKLFENINLESNPNNSRENNVIFITDKINSVKFTKQSLKNTRSKHNHGRSIADSAIRVSIELVDKSKNHSKSRSKSINREIKSKTSEFNPTSTLSGMKKSGYNIATANTVENFNVITGNNNLETDYGNDDMKSNNPTGDIKLLSSFVDSGGFLSETKINNKIKKENKNGSIKNASVIMNVTKSPIRDIEFEDYKYRLDTKESKDGSSYVNNYIKKMR